MPIPPASRDGATDGPEAEVPRRLNATDALESLRAPASPRRRTAAVGGRRRTPRIVAIQWQNPRVTCADATTLAWFVPRRSYRFAGFRSCQTPGGHGCHAEGRGFESLQPLGRNARSRAENRV